MRHMDVIILTLPSNNSILVRIFMVNRPLRSKVV